MLLPIVIVFAVLYQLLLGTLADGPVCDVPPKVEGTLQPQLDDPQPAVGTVFIYQCEFGYVGQDSRGLRSVCTLDKVSNSATWTKPNVTCIPRSCGDPGYVPNAQRIGNLFTFPNKVDFLCQEGYKLKGSPSRYCQASGTWSGKLPTCNRVYCDRPANPENGRVIYISLEYGTVLRYECDKTFVLSENAHRTCTEDGTWSNNDPVCIEPSCEQPLSPEHGSMQLLGDDAKVNSIVLYSCDDGTKLVGSSASKCLVTGQWTFPPPKCVRPCVLSDVPNGDLGETQTRRGRFGTEQIFVMFQVGTIFEHGTSATLRCNGGYEPSGRSHPYEGSRWSDEVVTCDDGQWSPPLECQPASCLAEPRRMRNGYWEDLDRSHGSIVNYHCNIYYVKTAEGEMKCSYGNWIGDTPTCTDGRCYIRLLNSPGLEIPEKEFIEHDEDFQVSCTEGFKVSNIQNKVSCRIGIWNIPDRACIEKECTDAPPEILHGRFHYQSRDHNSKVEYECEVGYEIIGSSTVKCQRGEWKGQEPLCVEKKCLNAVPRIQNGRFRFNSRDHNSKVEYECNAGYEMSGLSTVKCRFGEWKGEKPFCVEAPCRKKPRPMNNGYLEVTDNLHGSVVSYHCNEYYVKIVEGEVKCSYGNWTGHTPTCADGRCYINQLNYPGFEEPNVEFIEHEKELPVSCRKGFKASNLFGKVSCRFGNWRIPVRTCVEAPCLEEPQPTDNGILKMIGRSHGSVATYYCNEYYVKIAKGEVRCSYGNWIGHTPTCTDGRCYINKLNYPGFEKPNMEFIKHGEKLPVSCMKGFKASNRWKKVSCKIGNWNITGRACIEEGCPVEPPEILHGRFRYKNRDHNSKVEYSCDRGYEMSGRFTVQCLNGEWTGQPLDCVASNISGIEITEEVPSSYPTTTASSKAEERISGQPENCSCKYRPGSTHLVAVVNETRLKFGNLVKKGDTAGLSCDEPHRHLFWRNGMRIKTANLTCDVCQKWGSNDLPSCERTPEGDSIIVLEEAMNVLPGGAVECQHGVKLKVECVNLTKPDPSSFVDGITEVILNLVESVAAGQTSTSVSPSNPTSNAPASTTTSSGDKEDCFCTYNITDSILYARYGIEQLSYGAKVERGHQIELTCMDQSMHLVQSNGTKIKSRILKLTCNECETWEIDLPTCRAFNDSGANIAGSISEVQTATSLGPSNNPTPTPPATVTVSSEEENCTCTYNIQEDKLTAMIGRIKLSCKDEVKRGYSIQLVCTDSAMDLIMPNGTKSISGILRLTCTKCETWEVWNLPTCKAAHHLAPGCLIEDFSDTAPKNMNLDLEGVTENLLPVGSELPMFCEKEEGISMVLIGRKKATCGPLGKWEYGKALCGVGCHLNVNDENSQLIISPAKRYYNFEESTLLSCPEGLELTPNVQVLTCFENGWSNNIPDCQHKPGE